MQGRAIKFLVLLAISLASTTGYAQKSLSCFLMATTIYEQTYCEIIARGEGKQLPHFGEFKKNPPSVQFSLLKRPAEKLRIPLVASGGKQDHPKPLPAPPAVVADISHQQTVTSPVIAHNSPVCEADAETLRCEGHVYYFVYNKANRDLPLGILDQAIDRQLFEPLTGGLSTSMVSTYYTHYLQTMNSIGLAGETLTWTKFNYLYQDATQQGLHFGHRLLAMFGFLQRDKATINVGLRKPDLTHVIFEQCLSFDQHWAACELAGRNYLYLNMSNTL